MTKYLHRVRFRLRMMRFGLSTFYVPGTTLCAANAFSRFPLCDVNSNVPNLDIFVASIVKSLPIRDVIIDEICTATTSDRTLQIVINHCQTGWPKISSFPPDVQQFAQSHVHLTVLCATTYKFTALALLYLSHFAQRYSMLFMTHIKMKSSLVNVLDHQYGGRKSSNILNARLRHALHAQVIVRHLPSLYCLLRCLSYHGKRWRPICLS